MRLFHTTICAALIALTPLAASAHRVWRRGEHHHTSRLDPSERATLELIDTLLFGAPLGVHGGSDLADAHGRLRRSAVARDAFERRNPCPATGLPHGACPGYVVDHIIPLKRGGADDPSNMQWQTIADAKAKDKIE